MRKDSLQVNIWHEEVIITEIRMEIKGQDEWRETGYRDFANQAGNCGAVFPPSPHRKMVPNLKLKWKKWATPEPSYIFKDVQKLGISTQGHGSPLRSSTRQDKFRVLNCMGSFLYLVWFVSDGHVTS